MNFDDPFESVGDVDDRLAPTPTLMRYTAASVAIYKSSIDVVRTAAAGIRSADPATTRAI